MGACSLNRRELLLMPGMLAGCEVKPGELQGGWVGAHADRGHRLRGALPPADGSPVRRTNVLIVGGGVSGLACARALAQAGVDDVALLELEDEAGGNARGHQMAAGSQTIACPLGAHYLPLPGPDAPEVYQLLEELGLVRQQLGRPVYDERQLCHAPQERLFFEGRWQDGLLPPARSAATRDQYLRFAAAVSAAQNNLGFAMPSVRAPWTAGHATLDAQTFGAWLAAQGLNDPQLLWYLDYCCRDDYGATAAEVSAWAGIHYFASRHGFHPPGDESREREAVLTWPEGNAWLTRRMAAGLGERIHKGRTVLAVSLAKHQIEVLAWNEAEQAPERWVAQQIVLATPVFIAARLLAAPPEALRQATRQLQYAPWLVANLQLRGPLLDRLGAPPAWDNVAYRSASLGYVDATHQSLKPSHGASVLTAYWALPRAQRPALLQAPWQDWARRVLADLQQVHPDLPQQLQRADLMRWGHAMSIPLPGIRGLAALAALREAQAGQRVYFAHGDLAGYSVFEEAYTQGVRVAQAMLVRRRAARPVA
ncbi:NAD(P)/FAD-dependent oxidoreductase [soil metagenome]